MDITLLDYLRMFWLVPLCVALSPLGMRLFDRYAFGLFKVTLPTGGVLAVVSHLTILSILF